MAIKTHCLFATALAFGSLVLGSLGCAPPPKILVGHGFAGPNKSTKVMIHDSGEVNPANKMKVFDVWMRVCDQQGSAESACKDTKILENVVPVSIY
jgi:hypothetical protein